MAIDVSQLFLSPSRSPRPSPTWLGSIAPVFACEDREGISPSRYPMRYGEGRP